jgi:hypothetical protein
MRSTQWGFVLLMGAALVFSAAGVSAQVIDSEFDVSDDKSDSTAFIDAEGDDYEAQVTGVCTSGSGENIETVTVTVTSSHPDTVKISDKKAQVAQRNKSNPVSDVNVDFAGDGDPVDFNVDLTCTKKSTVDVSVQPSKNSGKFKADMQDCTGLNASQGATVALVCDGNSSVKGKFDDSIGDISKLKISGKGSVTTTTTTTTTAPPTTTTTLPPA